MSTFKELIAEAKEMQYKLNFFMMNDPPLFKRFIHHIGEDYIALCKKPDEPFDTIILISQIVTVEIKRP